MIDKVDPTGSEQAATKVADAPAAQGADATGEQVDKDLDALLAEHDQAAPTEQAAPPKTEKPAGDIVSREEFEEFKRESTRKATRDAVAENIVAMKSENPALSALDDDLIEGMLDAKARRDPRIAEAFAAREEKPEAWSQIRTKLGQELAGVIGSGDNSQQVADQEAARASVRGTSTSAPAAATLDNAELSKLSDAEINQKAEEMKRAAR